MQSIKKMEMMAQGKTQFLNPGRYNASYDQSIKENRLKIHGEKKSWLKASFIAWQLLTQT